MHSCPLFGTEIDVGTGGDELFLIVLQDNDGILRIGSVLKSGEENASFP